MISDQLRQQIETCGKTRYQIAKEAHVEQATLSRFVAGTCGLRLDVVDRLAAYFKLELRKVK